MAAPSDELTQAINYLHAAIAAEHDPKHVQILSQCLQNMTRVQAELMQPAQGPQAAVMQQLQSRG